MNKLFGQFYSNTPRVKDRGKFSNINTSSIISSNKNLASNNNLDQSRNSIVNYQLTDPGTGNLNPRTSHINMNGSRDFRNDPGRKNFIESINKSMFSTPKQGSVTMNSSQEVQGINPFDENHDSKRNSKQFDISMAENISDNIELFKLEITNQLMKIQRGQSKLKMGDLLDELAEFKQTFKKTIEQTNKKREEEISNLTNDMKTIRAEIQESITKETSKHKKDFIDLQGDVKLFKNDMNSKLDILEKKQQMQMEQVRYLMMNSSDEKVRQMASKFLPDYNNTLDKEVYVKPSKDELSNIIEDLNIRKQRTNKKLQRRDTIEIENTMQFITKKKQNIKEIDAHFMAEDPEEEDIENFKKNKLADVTQNVKYERNKEFKKNLPIINKKLNELDKGHFKMSRLNKFRSYVHAVRCQIRLKNSRKEMNAHIRIASLKYFLDNYNNVENNIKNWIITATKTAYISVKNFEQLQIDLTSYSSLAKSSSSSDLKEKYIKLEIRIKSFIDQLIENTNEKMLDFSTLAFLKIIITSDSLIPYKLFTLFELSRLELNCGEIIDLSKTQQELILCIFIIIKIFVRKILIDTNGVKNNNVRKNFKMIASCLFHSTLEYFKSKCNIITKIKDFNDCVNSQENSNYDNKKNYEELQHSKGVDRRYIIAVNRVAKKKIVDTKTEEKTLFKNINKILPSFSPDDDCNDIQSISSNLFKLSELDAYFKLAKQNNFDLMSKIMEFINKLMSLVLNEKKK